MVFNKRLGVALTVALMGFSGATLAYTKADCKMDDAVILKDINEKMSADKAVSTSNIDVKSNDCMVILSGNLKTGEEASTAIEIASSTPGVLDVNTDTLMVSDSKQPFTDGYITAKVKGAFVREKVFGDQPISVTGIHVDTKNGVVYLTGDADPSQAKNAENLARKISGVKGVESKINAMPKTN